MKTEEKISVFVILPIGLVAIGLFLYFLTRDRNTDLPEDRRIATTERTPTSSEESTASLPEEHGNPSGELNEFAPDISSASQIPTSDNSLQEKGASESKGASDADQTDNATFKHLRQVIAEKSPSFEKEWTKVVESGSPDEFLALKHHPENNGLLSYGVLSIGDAFSTFSEFGMRPFFVAVDEEESQFKVAQGGTAEIRLTAEFDMHPGSARQEECKLFDIAISPEFPMTHGLGQTGWFKATDGTLVGTIKTAIVLKIPDDTPTGEVSLRITATTKGPHEGVVSERPMERQFRMHILPSEEISRENILCFWNNAVVAAEWLREYPTGDSDLKAKYEGDLRSALQYLERVGSTQNEPLTSFSKQLLSRPESKQ